MLTLPPSHCRPYCARYCSFFHKCYCYCGLVSIWWSSEYLKAAGLHMWEMTQSSAVLVTAEGTRPDAQLLSVSMRTFIWLYLPRIGMEESFSVLNCFILASLQTSCCIRAKIVQFKINDVKKCWVSDPIKGQAHDRLTHTIQYMNVHICIMYFYLYCIFDTQVNLIDDSSRPSLRYDFGVLPTTLLPVAYVSTCLPTVLVTSWKLFHQ